MHIHVYADPGHSWGKVSKAQLTRLGLTFGHFSNFSYRRDDFIYLEEDDDLSYFAKVHEEKLGSAPTWAEHHSNKSSRIRNYPRNLPGEAYAERHAAWLASRATAETPVPVEQTIINLTDLTFERAGSDYLGVAWSAHVTGFDFEKGKRYTLKREDGSTFEVVACEQERMGSALQWHLVDAEDGAFFFN